jgi:predicted neutral ceramidase superfamily lipid hydrolase
MSSVSIDPASIAVDCKHCGKPIESNHIFCPYCGRRQKQGEAWYYGPVWIVVLAFTVLGPFALYFVWNSSRMGRITKLFLAAMILAYTFYCMYVVFRLTQTELGHLHYTDQLLRSIR